MSDDGSTDEEKRKKREMGDGCFKKIKKIPCTPEKAKYTEDKLEKLMDMMQKLMQDVGEIKSNQEEYKEQIKELKLENEELRKENKELKMEIDDTDRRLEIIEREKRRNNVGIQGLNVNSGEQSVLIDSMENFIKNHLEIDVKVKYARKLGHKTCLLQLNIAEEKGKIMKNKSKLKNFRDINDDMTRREREVQGKIRKIAKEENQKGKQVKAGFQKITIDGQRCKWNKEEEVLEITVSKN